MGADVNALIASRDRFSAARPERAERLGGRRWGAVEAGEGGPALLMLPGTLGRADIFWRVIEPLSRRARVLAVTYPSTHDLAQWAGDLMRLLDRRGIERAFVLGSSLGGYLAQWIAGRHGDRCAGLIAGNTLRDATLLRILPAYAPDLETTPVAVMRARFESTLAARAAADPSQAELSALLMAEASGRIPARHLRARLLALRDAPALPASAVPRERIFVIESADDPLIPPPMRDEVRAALRPAATFRFLRGGHFPYVLRPDLYAAAVEEALGLEAPGAGPWGGAEERER